MLDEIGGVPHDARDEHGASGSLTFSNSRHSCSWQGLEASIE